VPFERFPELKSIISDRKRWKKLEDKWSYFESYWKPNSWNDKFKFVFMRQKVKEQRKGPLQLELFAPKSYEFDYKVIVTNKVVSVKHILNFHNGRGSQEGIFAESKQHAQLEYVPVKKLNGNKLYCVIAMMTHNLNREMQIHAFEQEHGTTMKRRALWSFETLASFRKKIIQRAGRLIRPQGKLILVMANNSAIRDRIAALMRN